MEKRFHDVDHRAQFIGFRSPSSVSSGAARVHKNLQIFFSSRLILPSAPSLSSFSSNRIARSTRSSSDARSKTVRAAIAASTIQTFPTS